MSDRLSITRRDFLNGIALGTAAGASLSPAELLAKLAKDTPYPPLLTGLRGSHPGSFEVAHSVAWAGATWPRPDALTDREYDLVVVGGGISGLAAAFLFRQRAGNDATVLVLDNHDDFGGHAKRNEFVVDGRTLIGYGGSQSLDGPSSYSRAARQLLVDVGIDTRRFYDYFDQRWYEERGLGTGMWFSAARYGRDVTVTGLRRGGIRADTATIDRMPLPAADRDALKALLTGDKNLVPELSGAALEACLRRTSYRDFLLERAGVPESVYLLYRDNVRGLWGVGWDGLSTLEAWRRGMPGTRRLGLAAPEGDAHGEEPYIFHFPDGNAGVTRALVRQLVPAAVPGESMEDLVTARVDYGALDADGAACRIRLECTAVDVRHAPGSAAVDVTYVRAGKPYRVRGRHAVLACYNNIIPSICPELPATQAEAIAYATKVPLVYVSVAVRNWRAFAELGIHHVDVPQPELMHSFGLDFPVSMGGYDFTSRPDQPTVIHGTFVPTVPDRGLSAREQHRLGRRRLYEMTWGDFESGILAELEGALAPGGFDAARDIAAITVNRWPHGYAYEYNDYSDPPEYGRHVGPHVAGRAPIGRISIANSDASAYAYVDGAIDAARRAVDEQFQLS
ncbi:MAG TPA: NAD(P)-binding protein [Woeseiaceae bacterium]|nr:NAD(P)-binding protein [Woeseiaceae bacterium]